MKKSILIILAIIIIYSIPSGAQSLLNKVGKAVTNEVIGNNGSGTAAKQQEPEPSCACQNAELIVGLGGTLKLNYKETGIKTMDNGSLLLHDRVSGNFYIVKNGITTGPVSSGDSRLSGFEDTYESGNEMDILLQRYKEYISKAGEKYTINFNGKSYGPYAQISSFIVTRSKNKFAALVIENIVISELDGKKMDDAIKNAKTDQERMQLAMKFSQQMQQKMMQGGGPESMTTKLVTNIPNATFDPLMGGTLNADMKYDDILVSAYDKIQDLQGRTIITLKQEHYGASEIFVSSDNSRYAYSLYGTLNFSDSNKPLTDLLNLRLTMVNGTVCLAYMYYSPRRNAIMQCNIPF